MVFIAKSGKASPVTPKGFSFVFADNFRTALKSVHERYDSSSLLSETALHSTDSFIERSSADSISADSISAEIRILLLYYYFLIDYLYIQYTFLLK